MIRFIKFVTIFFAVIHLVSCGSNSPPSMNSIALASSLSSYRLPVKPLRSINNSDAKVLKYLEATKDIATKQGLVFDGSRASSGIAFVGNHSKGSKSLVLAIQFFQRQDGAYVFEHVTTSAVADMGLMKRLERKFIRELKQTIK